MPDNDHSDARNITTLVLQGAADFAGIDLGKAALNIIETITLCGLGVAMAKDAEALAGLPDGIAACSVIKAVEESRVTVGLAYPANKVDVGTAKDGHRDFAGRDAVERACWAFTAKSRSVGLWHADGTEGHGTVVESAIHRGPDWTVTAADGTETVIKEGDWVCAVQWDVPTWTRIKAGELGGFSPQGRAIRKTVPPERLAQVRY